MIDVVERAADTPEWFRAALADEPSVAEVTVGGARISYRYWGDPATSGDYDLLLVHGGAAHSRWWDHLAPLLATGRRVVALDLSGHGDSDHRSEYGLDQWADEVHVVADAAGIGDHPIVAGHSLGGLITVHLAQRRELGFGGAIVIDSPIGLSSHERPGESEEKIVASHRVYPTAAAAIARFRPVPAQGMLPYVAAHIAGASVRERADGWTWKFDAAIIPAFADRPMSLQAMPCRTVLFAAQNGIVPADDRPTMTDVVGQLAVIEIPEAGHAIMLDQPLALLTGLRGVLAGWVQHHPR